MASACLGLYVLNDTALPYLLESGSILVSELMEVSYTIGLFCRYIPLIMEYIAVYIVNDRWLEREVMSLSIINQPIIYDNK